MEDEAMTECVRKLMKRGLNSTEIAAAIQEQHGVSITRQKVAVLVRHILSPDYVPPSRRPKKPVIHIWDAEREKIAWALWQSGATATDVADRLNNEFGTRYTKNAIIGKMHRIRLRREEKARSRPAAGLIRARERAKAKAKARPPKPKDRNDRQRFERVTLPNGTLAPLTMDFDAFTPPETSTKERVYGTAAAVASVTGCRWPYGDPISDKFHFCDEPQCDGSSYCAQHHAIAFITVPKA